MVQNSGCPLFYLFSPFSEHSETLVHVGGGRKWHPDKSWQNHSQEESWGLCILQLLSQRFEIEMGRAVQDFENDKGQLFTGLIMLHPFLKCSSEAFEKS